MEENFSFGYWLRRQRLARDLRQAELAQQLGIAPITLRKIEADERRPSLQLIERVAAVFALDEQERATLLQVARADLSPAALPLPERAHALGAAEAPAEAVSPFPSGTVTFLFTDIEGSTQRWERQTEAMRAALAGHDALLRQAIAQHGGAFVKGTGDGVLAAFARADDALDAALAAQRALQAADWGALDALPVRMALHSGAAEPEAGDYFGPTLNRTARILAAGHGGQILLSRATVELLRDQLPTTVQLRDLGSYHLKDLTQPEQIHQAVVADLAAEFPPLRTLDARRHNLPAQTTALIGREREVAELCDLLARAEIRLVTLTGPGGTGKTRLALQAVAELVEQFPDGVWFVNLAPISEAALVVPAIAQTLGIREMGGQTAAETLRDVLRDKQLLLVLDNFEQVIPAALDVGNLLAAAPQVKILVTSREALHLSAEQIVVVPSLSLPQRVGALPPEQLSQYESVRLFIERARAVQADFTITSANAPAVAEICWRLDGLPLAIELAAARIRLFSPEALLRRLEQRLQVLAGGPRDLPARQQTLRTAIDWSYALLTGDEQRLFWRLAVFANGCRLEAAEAVCDQDGALGINLLECLAALVDKSLLKQNPDPDGEPRFTMLETIREYALERLSAAGEADWLRRAHAAHYLELAESTEAALTSAQREAWLQRLDADADNLRAAFMWSRTAADGGDPMLRLAGVLCWLWYFRGYALTGRLWLEEALARDAGTPAARAKALWGAGALADQLGEHVTARQWLEESIALYRGLGDRRSLAYALTYLGLVCGHQGTHEDAIAAHQESIALFRAMGDRWGQALATQYLGEIHWFQAEFGSARALFEESARMFGELGDRWGYARALGLVGFVAHDQDDAPHARACFEESIPVMRVTGDKFATAAFLNKYGLIVRYLGEQAQAIAAHLESMALFRELGNRIWASDPLHNLGFIALSEHDTASARRYFEECLQLEIEKHDPADMSICLAGFACLAAAQQQFERATWLFGAAAARIESFDLYDPTYRRDCEQSLALVRAALDPSVFAAAWDVGHQCSLDEAIAYAREGV